MSTIPWRDKNHLKLQEPLTLMLTSVTSNKSSLDVYEVLLTKYFFTSKVAFSGYYC